MRIPAALQDAVASRTAVLFAGAGISYPALQVSGITLRDLIGSLIQRDYPDYDVASRSLEDVCDEYATLNDRPSLVDHLANAIPQNTPALQSHLVAVRAFRFIITTNWDLLFEDAYRQTNQRYQKLVRDADAPLFNYDSHNLLKIHGSADMPITLVATSGDYECYPDTHANLLRHVSDLLENNTVLFVGYGLRDEHVRRLLARVRGDKGAFARKAYAVGFYDEVRTRVLDKRNIEVLPYKADDFLPALAAVAKVP